MKNIKNKKKIRLNIYILLIIFKSSLNDCDREEPILKDSNCQLIYCDENQFSKNICTINNTIIKTQWLTNIIKISDYNYKYINIASNSKGDIFIETSPTSEESKRIFYALKNNGRPYFKNNENNEETPFYIMNELDSDLQRHESELVNIILNDDENSEYLMSISVDGYVEIYDFVGGARKYKSTSSFLGYSPKSLINISTNLKKGNIYYIIYPIFAYDQYSIYGPDNYHFILIFNFNSIEISISNSYYSTNLSPFYAYETKILSCFTTESSKIGCLFYRIPNYYSISLFDSDLNYLSYLDIIEINENMPYSFFKVIHFKGEILALYYYFNTPNNYGHLRIIEIKNYNDYYSDYYYSDIYNNYEDIIINKDSLNSTIYYNEFIKLNNYKLCIVSISNENKIYIITITLFFQMKTKYI